jgi:hypothetical protein
MAWTRIIVLFLRGEITRCQLLPAAVKKEAGCSFLKKRTKKLLSLWMRVEPADRFRKEETFLLSLT